MSTRATIRFATREEGVTFNEHPKKWNAQFYKHHDGYPEGLGVDLASCIVRHGSWNGVAMEIEHLDTKHSDLEFIYYIWQKPQSEAWISIFEVQPFVDQIGECIFVGRADKLIGKYKQNTNYDG